MSDVRRRATESTTHRPVEADRVTARVTGEANESVLRTLVQDAIDGTAE